MPKYQNRLCPICCTFFAGVHPPAIIMNYAEAAGFRNSKNICISKWCLPFWLKSGLIIRLLLSSNIKSAVGAYETVSRCHVALTGLLTGLDTFSLHVYTDVQSSGYNGRINFRFCTPCNRPDVIVVSFSLFICRAIIRKWVYVSKSVV